MRSSIKLLLVTLLLFTTSIFSQERLSMDVFADAKLAFTEDDHGNDAGTLDVLINVSYQFKQSRLGYFYLGQGVEYANLAGGSFFRYSIINAGYTFNTLLESKKLETSVALNYGLTKRWSQGFTNYGGTVDLAYAINNWLKFTTVYQLTRRNDLEFTNNLSRSTALIDPVHRSSFFFGFKINLARL